MALTEADVCVVIPAFNAEATIGRAIRSALAEPEAAEVIVVDDGSSDDTRAQALAADDGSGRLTVIAGPTSCGPAAARNRAIAAGRAAWICPLDSDDYFLPGRLARLRAHAEGWDFAADDLLRVNEHTPDEPHRRLIGDRLALPMQLDFAGFVRANISRPRMPRAELGFLKPLMRRAFLEAHQISYDERARLGEDFVLYATALARGARFRIVEPCGYVAVERADSLSSRHGAQDLRLLLSASQDLQSLPLSPAETAALRAHARHVSAKVKLREFLDAKRTGGLLAAAGVLARAPKEAPYVFTRAVLDRLKPA